MLSNKFIQAIIVLAVVFGLIMVIGIQFNFSVGASGISASIDRTKN